MPDIFVSFPFEERFDPIFRVIQELASKRCLHALRMDQHSLIATPVAEEISRLIRESRFVIADITGGNPNVLLEIGLAQGFGKPLILITQEPPPSSSFNVRGLQMIKYDENKLSDLSHIIDRALSQVTSSSETLRVLLIPSSLGRPKRESRFVIAASPLSFRRAVRNRGGYKKLRRTSPDYVGVRGILQAFGLLYGFETLPDNIDPEDCDDTVLREPMNVYCIASPKANRWTAEILSELAERWEPALQFRADPSSRDLRNVGVSIRCDEEVYIPRVGRVRSRAIVMPVTSA